MIGITTVEASAYVVILDENSDDDHVETYTRRVSRSATLDGSAETSDFGYTDADRTIVVSAVASDAEREILKTMIKEYAYLNVATKYGFFRVAPESLRVGYGNIGITLLVTE